MPLAAKSLSYVSQMSESCQPNTAICQICLTHMLNACQQHISLISFTCLLHVSHMSVTFQPQTIHFSHMACQMYAHLIRIQSQIIFKIKKGLPQDSEAATKSRFLESYLMLAGSIREACLDKKSLNLMIFTTELKHFSIIKRSKDLLTSYIFRK